MFKKLKEKITEEVKSSPQRFQQLTQSVSDRLQNASTSDENFFSIGEDDANTSNTSLEAGFTNVSLMSPQENNFRRSSTSSLASDVSFLPRYESMANMYHLQSDFEVSASEIEDNASTSSQLGHLSKEQIYTALQKSQMRYSKYRGRYSDLAKHYKDLERENAKMKSVLVETQDKAIRRVTELKEQCALEQKAKAHLEGALRDELDEKQFKIQSLETKIGLLQNGTLAEDKDNMEKMNKYLTDARLEIENLNAKIQELKANSIIFQTKEQEYKLKISELEKDISLFSEREKESNLTLAQNKMELHNELLSKDIEISRLKDENETLKNNLDVVTTGGGKLENLQTQNKKLIDKLEALTQKCNKYENDLLKMEQYRIELQNTNQLSVELKNKLKESEDQLQAVRDDTKISLLALEGKIKDKLSKEFLEKEEAIKSEFQNKLAEIMSNQSSMEELHLELMEKEEELKKLREVNEGILEELAIKTAKYDDLERNHLELIKEGANLRGKIGSLEKDIAGMQNKQQAADLNTARLQTEVANLEKELQEYKSLEENHKENETLLEENRGLLELKEKENSDLRQQIEVMKTAVQKWEENLEEKTKDIQDKFEEGRRELLQKLETSEETVKHLEEKSIIFTEGMKELAEKRDQITTLQEELQKSVQENSQLKAEHLKRQDVEEEKERFQKQFDELQFRLNQCEEIKSELITKVHSLEEEAVKLVTDLESERKKNEEMNKENVSLHQELRHQVNQTQLLVEKDNIVKDLEQTISNLHIEVSTLKESLSKKDETVTTLRDSLESLKQEQNQTLKEVSSLKRLLQETQDNLIAKERDLENLKTVDAETNSLLKDLEECQKREHELSVQLNDHKVDLRAKEQHIETLSKRFEKYHELIEQRNQGLSKIFNNFPSQPNHWNYNNLANVEEKLQNFEKTFSVEKENLGRILDFLQKFEGEYSSAFEERDELKNDKEELLAQIEALQTQIKEVNVAQTCTKVLEDELVRLKEENTKLEHEQQRLSQNVNELESRNTQVVSDSNFLSEENTSLITEIEALKLKNEEVERKYGSTELLVNDLKQNVIRLESDLQEASSRQQRLLEAERNLSELQREKQILQEEIRDLKAAPVNSQNTKQENEENYLKEIEHLRTKVVQYKSLDLTNRSSIEFYENELQKLKNQNEKLNRKLDETLVTLNHCSELSNSTEIEYLKNVLYNYMMGKESLVLARVIAAVCKFDPHQTETILAKEQQKQTLLGHLGIL